MIKVNDIFGYEPKQGVRNIITLGKFDGVHRGHQKLFEIMRDICAADQQIVAFTFDLSIRGRLTHSNAKSIYDSNEKELLLEKQGVDILVECPFTDEIRLMEAEDFVKDILIDKLSAAAIVIGDDFCFGKDRKGNAELLERLSALYGYKFIKIPKLVEDGEEISSTLIRSELEKGNMEKVNNLLGHPYFIVGEIVHGARLGHTIGFPTINQVLPESKLCVPFGVYFSKVTIDGKCYSAMSNIGIKPTVDYDGCILCESYILDFDEDVYGKVAKTELFHYSRPEKKFSGLEELNKRLNIDVMDTKKYFM